MSGRFGTTRFLSKCIDTSQKMVDFRVVVGLILAIEFHRSPGAHELVPVILRFSQIFGIGLAQLFLILLFE